ncbi:TolC family protein [Rhodanobacter sp. DHG33]|uniref:TolC family protein n=1 Tax=Rhodanobacter sp. DHG33 TaxID=2775921 RepID=UPI001781FB8F|nr:TolC family protein [Rhodanobacter sp. DHG33]MBD8899374.1 TolC family protein [Rhodanobacter sp. DHG33]
MISAARPRPIFRIALIATAALLCGCATYHPLPLGNGAGAASVAQLSVPAGTMPVPAWTSHRFDPANGLDVTDVAMLAVANNPDLKVQRDGLGISRAQAFAAGLLPDPQLSFGEDLPHGNSGESGVTRAYSLGIAEDVSSILLRSSRKHAANAQAKQVNLDLLWAEWQTIAQARLLFEQVQNLRTQQTEFDAEQRALAPVDQAVQAAVRNGNLSYDGASAGLNAMADARKQASDNAVALHQAESDLRQLLGLAPTAPLDLVGEPYRADPDDAQLQAALADLPRRRPDLLALQAGYRAQEATLRGAILAQFPAISVGLNNARDNTGIKSSGYTINLSLPLFDRNRGNIAIETATRQQLKDDYEARLLATRGDMLRLAADLRTLDARQQTQAAHAKQLDAARDAAQLAWQQGLIDWPTYLSIRSNALAADTDLIALRQSRSTTAIALEALLGRTDFVMQRTSKP